MNRSNFAKEYNPDVLEAIIDEYRFEEDWAEIVKCIERYAHVFDSGVAVGTKQHPDLKRVKAYYWVCMAEVLYKSRGDFVSAVDCLRRAMSIDDKYADTKIMCSVILLHKTKPLFDEACAAKTAHSAANKKSAAAEQGASSPPSDASNVCGSNPQQPSVVDDSDLVDFSLDLSFIMGTSYHSMSPSDQLILDSILDSQQNIYKNAVLAILGCFHPIDVLHICRVLLLEYARAREEDSTMHSSSDTHAAASSSTFNDEDTEEEEAAAAVAAAAKKLKECVLLHELFLTLIRLTSLCLLNVDHLRLDHVVDKYTADAMSAYRAWLWQDAVLTRAVLYEGLGDYRAARVDLLHLLHYSLDSRYQSLPKICQGQTVAAACRLPIVELQMGMPEEALTSFEKCVSTEGALQPYLPCVLLTGLSVASSVLHLRRAYEVYNMLAYGSEDKRSRQRQHDTPSAPAQDANYSPAPQASNSSSTGGGVAEGGGGGGGGGRGDGGIYQKRFVVGGSEGSGLSLPVNTVHNNRNGCSISAVEYALRGDGVGGAGEERKEFEAVDNGTMMQGGMEMALHPRDVSISISSASDILLTARHILSSGAAGAAEVSGAAAKRGKTRDRYNGLRRLDMVFVLGGKIAFSQVLQLPKVQSDPSFLVSSTSNGLIGTLLAAIAAFKDCHHEMELFKQLEDRDDDDEEEETAGGDDVGYSKNHISKRGGNLPKSNVKGKGNDKVKTNFSAIGGSQHKPPRVLGVEVLNCLEWGLSMEISNDDVNLLWNLGSVYCATENWEDAAEILRQCYDGAKLAHAHYVESLQQQQQQSGSTSASSFSSCSSAPTSIAAAAKATATIPTNSSFSFNASTVSESFHFSNNLAENYASLSPILYWMGFDAQIQIQKINMSSTFIWLVPWKYIHVRLCQANRSTPGAAIVVLNDAIAFAKRCIAELYYEIGGTILKAVYAPAATKNTTSSCFSGSSSSRAESGSASTGLTRGDRYEEENDIDEESELSIAILDMLSAIKNKDTHTNSEHSTGRPTMPFPSASPLSPARVLQSLEEVGANCAERVCTPLRFSCGTTCRCVTCSKDLYASPLARFLNASGNASGGGGSGSSSSSNEATEASNTGQDKGVDPAHKNNANSASSVQPTVAAAAAAASGVSQNELATVALQTSSLLLSFENHSLVRVHMDEGLVQLLVLLARAHLYIANGGIISSDIMLGCSITEKARHRTIALNIFSLLLDEPKYRITAAKQVVAFLSTGVSTFSDLDPDSDHNDDDNDAGNDDDTYNNGFDGGEEGGEVRDNRTADLLSINTVNRTAVEHGLASGTMLLLYTMIQEKPIEQVFVHGDISIRSTADGKLDVVDSSASSDDSTTAAAAATNTTNTAKASMMEGATASLSVSGKRARIGLLQPLDDIGLIYSMALASSNDISKAKEVLKSTLLMDPQQKQQDQLHISRSAFGLGTSIGEEKPDDHGHDDNGTTTTAVINTANTSTTTTTTTTNSITSMACALIWSRRFHLMSLLLSTHTQNTSYPDPERIEGHWAEQRWALAAVFAKKAFVLAAKADKIMQQRDAGGTDAVAADTHTQHKGKVRFAGNVNNGSSSSSQSAAAAVSAAGDSAMFSFSAAFLPKISAAYTMCLLEYYLAGGTMQSQAGVNTALDFSDENNGSTHSRTAAASTASVTKCNAEALSYALPWCEQVLGGLSRALTDYATVVGAASRPLTGVAPTVLITPEQMELLDGDDESDLHITYNPPISGEQQQPQEEQQQQRKGVTFNLAEDQAAASSIQEGSGSSKASSNSNNNNKGSNNSNNNNNKGSEGKSAAVKSAVNTAASLVSKTTAVTSAAAIVESYQLSAPFAAPLWLQRKSDVIAILLGCASLFRHAHYEEQPEDIVNAAARPGILRTTIEQEEARNKVLLYEQQQALQSNRARRCVEQAWSLLHVIDPIEAHELAQVACGAPMYESSSATTSTGPYAVNSRSGGQRVAHKTQQTSRFSWGSKKSTSSAQTAAAAAATVASATDNNPNTSPAHLAMLESRRINILKQMPTIAGWRLTDATGWSSGTAAAGMLQSERADILCELAAVQRYCRTSLRLSTGSDTQRKREKDTDTCLMELYEQALAVSPDHVPSLMGMARLQLKIGRNMQSAVSNSNSAGSDLTDQQVACLVPLAKAKHLLARALQLTEPQRYCPHSYAQCDIRLALSGVLQMESEAFGDNSIDGGGDEVTDIAAHAVEELLAAMESSYHQAVPIRSFFVAL